VCEPSQSGKTGAQKAKVKKEDFPPVYNRCA